MGVGVDARPPGFRPDEPGGYAAPAAAVARGAPAHC
jgi:hypothetical protein